MAKDIIYDDNDIQFENGDFKFAEAEDSRSGINYHAIDIILTQKGQFYQSPLVGVGISTAINSKRNPVLKAEINKQLRDDKFQIHGLSVIFAGKNVDIEVDATKNVSK